MRLTEVAKLPLAERRDVIYQQRIAELEADLATLRAAVVQWAAARQGSLTAQEMDRQLRAIAAGAEGSAT